jgi:uracil phosphoribosyltransferase
MSSVTVVNHPLVQHKLTLMRRTETATGEFRRLLREIRTPIAPMRAPALAGKKLCFVSVLRAGSGILEGMLDLVPSARVGHIGLYRDPETLAAVEYYFKVPDDIPERDVIVVDPMVATANSAIAALHRLKGRGARSLKYVCLVAAPEGIRAFRTAHADVPIFTAAIDDKLNDHGYIVPGLGDAGDRLFGTK